MAHELLHLYRLDDTVFRNTLRSSVSGVPKTDVKTAYTDGVATLFELTANGLTVVLLKPLLFLFVWLFIVVKVFVFVITIMVFDLALPFAVDDWLSFASRGRDWNLSEFVIAVLCSGTLGRL